MEMSYLKKTASITTLIACGVFSHSGFANEKQDLQRAELLERLQKLEQEVKSLQAQLDSPEDSSENSSQQQQRTTEDTGDEQTNKVNWKGAPEIANSDGWSVKPRGRMLYDFAYLTSVPETIDISGEGFSNEARRVRLGIQGSMPGGFAYKLEADLPGGLSLTDAYLKYKSESWNLTFGQHNNFQSLEELTSSNDVSFLERAAFTDAFGFQRKLGVSAATKVGMVNIQGGFFTDNVDDLDDGNNGVSLDMRAFVSPKISEMQFHIGGSIHARDLGDSIDSLRYRARPMVHSVDTRFVNTGQITDAERENSYGLEAALISGALHMQAELHSVTVKRKGLEDPTFLGGAIELGLFLTNDQREYKGGVFKGTKVNQPISSGGIGAWQVNFRYDYLDLEDGEVLGGKQDGFMASLIWLPVDNVRLLMSYGHLSYRGVAEIVSGAPDDFSVNVWGVRSQVSF